MMERVQAPPLRYPRRRRGACAALGAGLCRLQAATGFGALAAATRASLSAEPHARRPFSLLGDAAAGRILEEGFLGAEVIGEHHAALAHALSRVVSAAVLRIRTALVEGGHHPELAPLSGDVAGLEDFDSAMWCTPSNARPDVWRLAITGGPCAGKTTGMVSLREGLEQRGAGGYMVFVMPEVATILFHLGVMSNGTFANFELSEYRAFGVQETCLQLALEEIWASGAEAALRAGASARRAVLLVDRDAINFKTFSWPIDPAQPVSWREVLQATGELIGRPGLTEADLVRRYELGVLILQSFALLHGRLNRQGYKSKCLGLNGSNPVRKESAEQAAANDKGVRVAYAEAYPEEDICLVTNNGMGMAEKMDAAGRCVWRQVERLVASAEAR